MRGKTKLLGILYRTFDELLGAGGMDRLAQIIRQMGFQCITIFPFGVVIYKNRVPDAQAPAVEQQGAQLHPAVIEQPGHRHISLPGFLPVLIDVCLVAGHGVTS